MLHPNPPDLDPYAVHALTSNKADYNLFLIPSVNRKTCVLVSWRTASTPPIFLESSSPEIIRDSIKEFFPAFGEPDLSSIGQLFRQRPSVALTIRCNRYHDVDSRILLVGDAAHSTGGTLGQGANSALQDIVALDQCLDATDDDLDRALPLFSERQVPEGLALWSLLQLPPPGLPGAVFSAIQAGRLFLSGRFPGLVDEPVQRLLSQST
eukprot:gene5277-6731_t